MKQAWICYEHDDNFDIGYNPHMAVIIFEEPLSKWKYAKIVHVVFTELVV